MSWHYLQGQEEACWGRGSLGSIPSELASLIPSRGESSSPDNATDTSTGSLSGTTSTPSTVGHGEAQFSLCPVVFPAKTSPRRVRVEDCPATVQASSSRCSESLKRFGLALSSRKTARSYVPVGLASSSKSLTAWGIEAHGAFWELGTSVRLIEGTECGSYLPTPTASHYGTRNNGKRGDGSTFKTAGAPSLQTMAKKGTWPTPNSRDWKDTGVSQGNRKSPNLGTMVNRWPTPTAGDSKSSGRRNINPQSKAHPGTSLTDAVNGGPTTQRTGKLNPSWVEFYLMGWPLDWTETRDSKPLGTDKFRAWLLSHGTF